MLLQDGTQFLKNLPSSLARGPGSLPEDLRALTPLIYSHVTPPRDFSARHESEAGDRTRCDCCMMLRAALLCAW